MTIRTDADLAKILDEPHSHFQRHGQKYYDRETVLGLMGRVAAAEVVTKGAKVASDRANCEWTPDGDDCHLTACGKHFYFSDGGVADNGFEFCPFCGGAIHIQNEPDS